MRLLIEDCLDKKPDFSSLSQLEQVKYMAFFVVKVSNDPVFTQTNIRDSFELVHLPSPRNLSRLFALLDRKKTFLKKHNGYTFHRNVFQKFEKEFSEFKPKQEISQTLRSLIPKLGADVEREFLAEAISCYEVNAYRAAIIMTWILAVDHLYAYILLEKKVEFNAALVTRNSKLRNVDDKEDFTEISESEFILVCRTAKIITNDVKKVLEEKLGIRNSCSHPNRMKITESKATDFIEDLVLNVILKYCK